MSLLVHFVDGLIFCRTETPYIYILGTKVRESNRVHLTREQKDYMMKDIISGVFDAPLDASSNKDYKRTLHYLYTIKQMAAST